LNHALRTLLCASVCWTALCGTPLRAQQSAPQPPLTEEDESSVRDPLEALRKSYRPAIHPGNPLNLVGIEQGDNDLRAATPQLARGEHTPLQVDIEASHQRALAMYGNGARFHAALPPASQSALPTTTRPQGPIEPDAAPEERAPEAKPWSLLAGLLASVLLIVWFFVRVRPALVAPQADSAPAPEAFVWRPTRRVKAPKPAPHLEQPAPLPQKRSGLVGGAQMAKQPKRR